MNTKKQQLDNLVAQYRSINSPVDFSARAMPQKLTYAWPQWLSIPRLTLATSTLAVFLTIGLFIQLDKAPYEPALYVDLSQVTGVNPSWIEITVTQAPSLSDIELLPDMGQVNTDLSDPASYQPGNNHETNSHRQLNT